MNHPQPNHKVGGGEDLIISLLVDFYVPISLFLAYFLFPAEKESMGFHSRKCHFFSEFTNIEDISINRHI